MAIAAAATKLDIGVMKPLGEGERCDLVLDMLGTTHSADEVDALDAYCGPLTAATFCR